MPGGSGGIARVARVAQIIALPSSFLPSFLPPISLHPFATRHALHTPQQTALHPAAAPRHQKKTLGMVVSPAIPASAPALTPIP